ncbi:MAG: hypothetical protein HYW23_03435 [Candidatus Aenigmarchaeota archaeon]|nr:hypothetical protein [Candidatus Aenigmarchaeota archaeon]
MNVLVDVTIGPAIEFIRKIKNGKVAIVHGHDNDSICSAAIIYRLLKKIHKIEPKLVASEFNYAISKNVLNEVKKLKAEYVIAVDLAEINVDLLTELRNISQVMLIDHHTPRGYVKITYVNPRNYDKSIYLPATYLCYKIYEKLADAKEILWIAGIGTLSDMGLKNCKDLFEDIKYHHKELIGNNENIDEILFDKSLLGKLAKIFDSARVVNGIDGAIAALDVLLKTGNYQNVLNGEVSGSKKLLDWYGLSEKEFNRLLKDFSVKKKTIKKFVLYEVKSKYNMKSALATYLSKKMSSEVLVIYQKSGEYTDVSFRRGPVSIMDLNQLAINSIIGMPDSNGGGHIQAAACRFPTRYFKKFMGNLKSI